MGCWLSEYIVYLCPRTYIVVLKSMGKTSKKMQKSTQEWKAVLDTRFDYLSPVERKRLVEGDSFVKVPSKELKRLKVDAYPYLM